VWKKRLEEDTPTKFLEVQVAGHGPSTPGDSSVEIRLRNGRSLMVRPGFDAEQVKEWTSARPYPWKDVVLAENRRELIALRLTILISP
jgi:hypothetical protein